MEAQNTMKGVTAVVYDKMDKPYFLLLKRKKNWKGWEFPKGAIKNGEAELDALKREIFEETGLQKFKIVKKIDGIKKEFTDKKNILKIHSVYLVEASMNIPIHMPSESDSEHTTYLWTDSESALSKLTWDNDKEILKKALEELN